MNLTHDRHSHLAGLIAAAAAGDHAAFLELHGLTHDYLYHTALRLLRLPSLAEDVLQDAYLSIWLHASSFRPGQASPMTWLIAIVRNRAFSILRSNRNGIASLMSEEDPALLAEQVQGDERDASSQVYDTLAHMRLEQAMTRLEPAQRQSIALAFGQELTHAEIARHLGVPLGTAKSWLRRGVERLRQYMEEPAQAQAIRLPAMQRQSIALGARAGDLPTWRKPAAGKPAPRMKGQPPRCFSEAREQPAITSCICVRSHSSPGSPSLLGCHAMHSV